MTQLLRSLFFLIIVKFIVFVILGVRISHRERLPKTGPAIIVANHNSHLDTMVLMNLFPIRLLEKIHPVAAADYFLQNRLLTWFSLNIIGIIPLNRQVKAHGQDPLQGCSESLAKGDILILYPEGTRGEPELLSEFQSGIAHLAKRHPTVPIYPVFLHGLGKALPKGEKLLVPFCCDVLIGEPIWWTGSKKGFMHLLNQKMNALTTQENFLAWE